MAFEPSLLLGLQAGGLPHPFATALGASGHGGIAAPDYMGPLAAQFPGQGAPMFGQPPEALSAQDWAAYRAQMPPQARLHDLPSGLPRSMGGSTANIRGGGPATFDPIAQDNWARNAQQMRADQAMRGGGQAPRASYPGGFDMQPPGAQGMRPPMSSSPPPPPAAPPGMSGGMSQLRLGPGQSPGGPSPASPWPGQSSPFGVRPGTEYVQGQSSSGGSPWPTGREYVQGQGARPGPGAGTTPRGGIGAGPGGPSLLGANAGPSSGSPGTSGFPWGTLGKGIGAAGLAATAADATMRPLANMEPGSGPGGYMQEAFGQNLGSAASLASSMPPMAPMADAASGIAGMMSGGQSPGMNVEALPPGTGAHAPPTGGGMSFADFGANPQPGTPTQPAGGSYPSPAAAKPNAMPGDSMMSMPKDGAGYSVQGGDTLFDIATSLGIPPEQHDAFFQQVMSRLGIGSPQDLKVGSKITEGGASSMSIDPVSASERKRRAKPSSKFRGGKNVDKRKKRVRDGANRRPAQPDRAGASSP